MILAEPVATEEMLIWRARRRDCEAFTELYARYVDRVRRHIAYIVRDAREVDDLTNQAFLQAWEAIPRFVDRGVSLRAWLLRIAHNLAIAHMTRHRPTEALPEQVEAGAGSSPEAVAEAKSEEERLRRAILRLPDVQRQVIVWRFLWGMDCQQVARLVEKSVGAVRVIQYRALAELRRMLLDEAGRAL